MERRDAADGRGDARWRVGSFFAETRPGHVFGVLPSRGRAEDIAAWGVVTCVVMGAISGERKRTGPDSALSSSYRIGYSKKIADGVVQCFLGHKPIRRAIENRHADGALESTTVATLSLSEGSSSAE